MREEDDGRRGEEEKRRRGEGEKKGIKMPTAIMNI